MKTLLTTYIFPTVSVNIVNYIAILDKTSSRALQSKPGALLGDSPCKPGCEFCIASTVTPGTVHSWLILWPAALATGSLPGYELVTTEMHVSS